jgi:hypothetical protein
MIYNWTRLTLYGRSWRHRYQLHRLHELTPLSLYLLHYCVPCETMHGSVLTALQARWGFVHSGPTHAGAWEHLSCLLIRKTHIYNSRMKKKMDRTVAFPGWTLPGHILPPISNIIYILYIFTPFRFSCRGIVQFFIIQRQLKWNGWIEYYIRLYLQ